MKQYQNLGDERQYSWCAFCGGDTLTRDHVPSKVLLDKPYPENLPVVSACQRCNAGFSMDEEYLACWIDVAKNNNSPEGTYPIREKISKILRSRPLIQAKIISLSGNLIDVDKNRLNNVLTKLAKGHALFELNESHFRLPDHITWQYLDTEERHHFELVPTINVFPEIGSRAFQKIIHSNGHEWQIVQKDRYRYLTIANGYVLIRIVLSEFLACEILWDEDF